MQTPTIGIDLGKTTFHLIALSEHSRVVIKFERSQVNSELLLLKATGIKRRYNSRSSNTLRGVPGNARRMHEQVHL